MNTWGYFQDGDGIHGGKLAPKCLVLPTNLGFRFLLFCFFVCLFFFGRLRLAVSMTDPKEFLSYDLFEEVNMLWWKMRRCRSVYWQLLFVISFSEGTMGNIVFRVNRSDDGHYISCSVNCQGIRLLLFGPILS